jgi:hypothetical protein
MVSGKMTMTRIDSSDKCFVLIEIPLCRCGGHVFKLHMGVSFILYQLEKTLPACPTHSFEMQSELFEEY